jgi:predicted O-methyltransferase YrrM
MVMARASNLLNNLLASIAVWSDHASNRRWYDSPLGSRPRAAAGTYQELADDAKAKLYPQIDQYEAQAGFAIDKNWMDEVALHTQIVIKPEALCYQHGRVLYSTLRKYLASQKLARVSIIETGTARGFSSLCMAKALDDAGTDGTIVTFDVLPHNVPMYWNCIDDASGPRTRRQLLNRYADLTDRHIIFHQGNTRIEIPKVQMKRVNFAFLDGAHTYSDVLLEFSNIKDVQETGDVIVFDDYTPDHFAGIVKAVDEICAGNAYDKRVITISPERGYVIATKR